METKYFKVTESMAQQFKDLYFEIHAIYEPDERGWYCAAVDLFRPGMTFRIYFTLEKNDQIKAEHIERWYFG